MKKILLLALLVTSNAFATGGFECSSNSGKVTVEGAIGAGMTLLSDVYVSHSDLVRPVKLSLSMKWVDKAKGEIKAASYDDAEDVKRLNLTVENGEGKLNLDLSDMPGGDDIIINDLTVNCIIE